MGDSVNVNIIVLVFVLILVIATVATLLIDPSTYSMSRWYVFIGTFASMSLIVTVMFYSFLVGNYDETRQLTYIKEVKRIGSCIEDVNVNEIRECSKIIPSFTASLMPLSDVYMHVESSPDEGNSMEAVVNKVCLSHKIFHVWETAVTCRDFLRRKKLTYTIAFLQWATSEQLEEQWDVMRVNYIYETRIFGDILFKHAKTIDGRDHKQYTECAKSVILEYRALL